MSINKSERQWYTYDELIEFLNDPATHSDLEIPNRWYERAAAAADSLMSGNPFAGLKDYYERQVEQTRQNLLRAVGLISNYKKKLEAARKENDSLEKLKWELAVKLNRKVMDSINSALQSVDFKIDFEIQTDRQKVFSRDEPWLIVSPRYGNYYITFLNLITDSDVGIDRLFKCDECGRVGIATYKRWQRFCSGHCRSQFHNRQRAPQMKEYMRERRRKKRGNP
ncbi:hypothetical protein MYX75_02070 [Acidobacteria bacterium AH-259-A15]|nr:hypothetical protein [Acidobacteria bacterium AH-259-A15]